MVEVLLQTLTPITGNMIKMLGVEIFIFCHITYKLVENKKNLSGMAKFLILSYERPRKLRFPLKVADRRTDGHL